MDECFRFLINIDQCLNMSYYDMFFYKLQSEKKYKLNQVQLFEKADTSLQRAIADIRTYLNKYPYHFKEYQFIVAMRSVWRQKTSEWQDTLLYRLTQLSYELHNQGIYMQVATKVERALNLIMLYEADASSCATQLDSYMSGERLIDDYMLLFSKMGLDGNESLNLEKLKSAYNNFRKSADCDVATSYLVERFIEEQDEVMDIDEESKSQERDIFKAAFSAFLKGYFTNYQVMELVISRDLQYAPRESKLALLRVVEFVNKSVEVEENIDIIPSLASRCQKNWNEIMADDDLEKKYSDMLFNYEAALKCVHKQLETDAIAPVHASAKLPQYPDESKEYINDKNNLFEDESKRTDFNEILNEFLRNHLSVGTAREKWTETHHLLKNGLDNLDLNLKKYADSLGKQYSDKIEKRKKEALGWEQQMFFASEETNSKISKLAERRDECLEKMKNPQMTPSLRFQDQINMENELEHRDTEIRKLIGCLEASTAINFVLTVLVVLVLAVVHYTVMQPFVFSETISTMAYLGYVCALLLLLALSWTFPRFYYRRMIKKSVKALIKSMDIYIPGYFAKANQFREYINVLNLFDSSIKYYTLYVTASETSKSVVQGCLWHKTQIKDHLVKLNAFRGLIDYGYDIERRDSFDEQKYTVGKLLYSEDKIKSVEDCCLYWPQGQGDFV